MVDVVFLFSFGHKEFYWWFIWVVTSTTKAFDLLTMIVYTDNYDFQEMEVNKDFITMVSYMVYMSCKIL